MVRHPLLTSAVACALGVGILAAALRASPATGQLPGGLTPLDATAPITYFIASGAGQPGYRASDGELAVWALRAWERSAGNRLRFVPAAESTALVRLYWSESNDGGYGEMRPLRVGGRRGAAVFIRPDVDSLGGDIARRASEDVLLRDTIVYLTCVHELGHALGFEHTRDFRDIMYFFGYGGDIVEFFNRYRREIHSRNDIAASSGLSAADVNRVTAVYGRK